MSLMLGSNGMSPLHGMYKKKLWEEPCGNHNAISYRSFCTLGGVNNPQLSKIHRHNGSMQYTTYHLLAY